MNKKSTNPNPITSYLRTINSVETAYPRVIAHISSILLASLIALLTFLLVVGVQNGITGFSTKLYIAIYLLGSNLVLYSIGNLVVTYFKSASNSSTIAAGLLTIIQRLLFAASIISVIWFLISYSQLVLNPKPIEQPVSQQGAPSSESSGPTPGETAEQHAAEQAQQQAPAPATAQ